MLTSADAWQSRIINSRLTHRERDEVIERAVSGPVGRASRPAPIWPAPIPPFPAACSPERPGCTGRVPGRTGSAG